MENKQQQPTPSSSSSSWGFGTKAILAGQEPDPTTGALVVPISLATTFLQDSPGVHKGFEYSRTDNPTRRAFEANVAACENARYGIGFASGSAATMTILHMLKAGDHVAAMDDCYGGTYRYFTKIATPMGLDFSFSDFSKEGEAERIITDKTKLIWMESPTNPTLKLTDIRKVAEVAKKRNILLVVDNTFMSPYFQNPLDLGADIVVHSVTKYLNGHSDVVMGMVLTNSDEIKTRLRFLQNGIGAVPSPFDCFLAMRGMKTLHLRMREHAKNALHIAQFLEAHPKATPPACHGSVLVCRP
jgi:cystathionine gamma-lyase